MSAAWCVAALLVALVCGLLARLPRGRFTLAAWMQATAIAAPGVAAGCVLGRWLALPEPLDVRVDGAPLPLLWATLGAALCLGSRAWLARHAAASDRAARPARAG
jgi:hypothetical protein